MQATTAPFAGGAEAKDYDSLRLVTRLFRGEESNGAAEIHEKAAYAYGPEFAIAPFVEAAGAVLVDRRSQRESMLAMLILFRRLAGRSVVVFEAGAEEMRVGTAIAMLDDVDVTNAVKLHGDIEVLKKHVAPGGVLRLHDAERRTGEDELIVAIRHIVSFHEVDDVVDQSQVHATEKERVVTSRRIRTAFGGASMNFQDSEHSY